MPNRIIKESICTSDNLTALDWGAQLFFLRLTVQCDDFGRFDGRPAILRAACYPLELDRVSEAQIQGWLDALAAAQLVQQYTVDGKRYLVLSTWSKHQRTRADKSKFPDPPPADLFCGHVTADARTCPQPLSNVPVNENVNGNVSESENGNAAPPPLPSSPLLAHAIRAFESSIGLVSGPTQGDEMAAMVDELHAKNLDDWWSMAVKVACDQNHRSWAYVRGILRNCLRDGKPPGAPKANGTGNARASPRRGSEWTPAELAAGRQADGGEEWPQPI